jgi:hypothetical protein
MAGSIHLPEFTDVICENAFWHESTINNNPITKAPLPLPNLCELCRNKVLMNVPKGIVLPNCRSDSYWFVVVSLLINVLKFSNLIMSDSVEYRILLTIMHNLNQFFYVTEDKKVIEYQLFINLTSRKRRNVLDRSALSPHRCFTEL